MTTSTPASTPPEWHIREVTLREYADGRSLPVVGASVESHLLGCSHCRERLGALLPQELLDQAWGAIRDQVEAPRASAAEKVVRRLGFSGESARLLVAVPAFRGAWLLGVLVVTLFAGLAALFAGDFGMSVFLILAPLAPVAGVAASFGGDADPAHELVATSPYPSPRLLGLRTLGVLATSVPLMWLIGLSLPGPGWVGVAWLTPALAGVLLTLLLGPLFGVSVTATAIAGCWSTAVVLADRLSDPLEVVAPTVQPLLAGVVVIALAALLVRYPSYDRLGGQP